MDELILLESLKEELSAAELEDLRIKLEVYINELILKDFHKLVRLLYRIDISEKKLKSILLEHPDRDAAKTISDMIIARQMEKIKSRKAFNTNNRSSDEEKW